MHKVSVIIPIYGVEKYIERCAHSLFQQTLESIEYIFVDDCTKDNSINILQGVINNYPHRKDDIRIVRTPCNSGLPQARMYGLKYATGNYIIHCDSDDWIEKKMFEKLYKKAVNDNLDIVSCDFFLSYTNSNIPYSCKGNTKSIKEYLSDIITQKISGSVCNKLIKNTLYTDKIIYPTQNMGEDLALIIQLILKSNKIGHISESLYHYCYNTDSISNVNTIKATYKKWNAINENIQLIQGILKENNIINDFSKELIILKEKSRRFILRPLIYKSEIRKLWLESYPEINLSPLNTISNNLIYILIYIRLYPLYIYSKQLTKKILKLIKQL